MAVTPTSPVRVMVPMPICGIRAPWASTYCIVGLLGNKAGGRIRPGRENARWEGACQPGLLGSAAAMRQQ